MVLNKICSCGKIISINKTCECKIQASRARNKARAQQNPEEKKFFNSKRWKVTRLSVIKRDNAHCQRCLIKYGTIEVGNLQVHHIKPRIKYNGMNGYPDLRFEQSNLITLCQSCNTQFQTKEYLDFEWQAPEEEWMPVL